SPKPCARQSTKLWKLHPLDHGSSDFAAISLGRQVVKAVALRILRGHHSCAIPCSSDCISGNEGRISRGDSEGILGGMNITLRDKFPTPLPCLPLLSTAAGLHVQACRLHAENRRKRHTPKGVRGSAAIRSCSN